MTGCARQSGKKTVNQRCSQVGAASGVCIPKNTDKNAREFTTE